MQFYFENKMNVKSFYLLMFFISTFLLTGNLCSAKTITIKDRIIIDKPTKFSNVTLNLTHNGGFTIQKNGSLDIENSNVDVIVSPTMPNFIHLSGGDLTLKNNIIRVTTNDINPTPQTQSLFQLLLIDQGTLSVTGNDASVDTPFTVGFLLTNQNFTTDGFNITNNIFKKFHGGLYLIHSNHAQVSNNTFANVSFANIFNMSNNNIFKNNIFSFPGSFNPGDTIDVFNSNDITIDGNFIESASSTGIVIIGSQNILIDNNRINDGLSYAIALETTAGYTTRNKYLSQLLRKYKVKTIGNSNITITNNSISQNRFGLSAEDGDNLIVKNNIFIQKFSDSATRQFWTNNDILLAEATNITWIDNLYKEAFTQENQGDNSQSLLFVSFPAHGGVILP